MATITATPVVVPFNNLKTTACDQHNYSTGEMLGRWQNVNHWTSKGQEGMTC